MQYPREYQEAQVCGEEAVARLNNFADELADEVAGKVRLCHVDRDREAFLMRCIYDRDFQRFNREWPDDCREA